MAWKIHQGARHARCACSLYPWFPNGGNRKPTAWLAAHWYWHLVGRMGTLDVGPGKSMEERRKRGKRTDNERPQDLEVPPGAPQQRFKLHEAACLLANVEPAWPLPNQLSSDKLDFLVDAVRVHDPDVKHVELRVVIPENAMRPLDSSFALRQHTYISQLRIRDAQQIAHLRDVKSGITCKELDREALHNVEVDRKVLREYLESKSRPVPEFLHEIHDKSDSGQ